MEVMIRELCWTLGLIAISTLIIILLDKVLLKPRKIRSVIRKQGIDGPKPSFPFGNVSEMQQIQPQIPSSTHPFEQWIFTLFPYLHTWKQRYGSLYLYSSGVKQHLFVGKPELIKELNLNMSLDIGVLSYLTKPLWPLFGSGIVNANGELWAFQRNLIAPEFFISKIKNMINIMEETTKTIIKKWETSISENKEGIAEIVIDTDMKVLTEDVISKACFGSDYERGNQIFTKLATMQAALSSHNIVFGFLNLSFLQSKKTKEMWRLKKEVDELIMNIIHEREIQNEKNKNEKHSDLLQKIIESGTRDTTSKPSGHDMNILIVDMCKNMYFTGSETVGLCASWTLLLLSLHPEWQHRVRSEILETFDHKLPHSFHDNNKFQKLKVLTMVIQESLRLYGPAVITARELFADMKLGEYVLPKGLFMWFLLPLLHRDTDNWGPDATEFKPERFANGVSAACKYPQAYIPFGFGTRICVGQNFALTEIKIILSLLIFNFSFEVSPNYEHCPVHYMFLVPKHGLKLLVSKVDHNTEKCRLFCFTSL